MNYKLKQNGIFTGLIEVWKDIETHKGLYQISSFGNIKSVERTRVGKSNSVVSIGGHLMKQKLSKTGYKVIHLRNNGKSNHYSTHRLVMLSFVKNPDNKQTVNHIDGNKTNNNISNLEWSTHSEQMIHANNIGLLTKVGSPKFSKEFKKFIYNYYWTTGVSIQHIANMFNMSERTAGRIIKGVIPRKTTRIKSDGTRSVEDMLTKEQVVKIKTLRNDGWTLSKLSKEFNRGISQIHRVVNNISRNNDIE